MTLPAEAKNAHQIAGIFAGETTTDILAKVLEGEPKWDALPTGTPSSIRILLEAALNKDTKQRLQHIGDTRIFLNRPSILDRSVPVVVGDRSARRGWFAAAFGRWSMPARFMRS